MSFDAQGSKLLLRFHMITGKEIVVFGVQDEIDAMIAWFDNPLGVLRVPAGADGVTTLINKQHVVSVDITQQR